MGHDFLKNKTIINNINNTLTIKTTDDELTNHVGTTEVDGIGNFSTSPEIMMAEHTAHNLVNNVENCQQNLMKHDGRVQNKLINEQGAEFLNKIIDTIEPVTAGDNKAITGPTHVDSVDVVAIDNSRDECSDTQIILTPRSDTINFIPIKATEVNKNNILIRKEEQIRHENKLSSLFPRPYQISEVLDKENVIVQQGRRRPTIYKDNNKNYFENPI